MLAIVYYKKEDKTVTYGNKEKIREYEGCHLHYFDNDGTKKDYKTITTVCERATQREIMDIYYKLDDYDKYEYFVVNDFSIITPTDYVQCYKLCKRLRPPVFAGFIDTIRNLDIQKSVRGGFEHYVKSN